MSVAVAVAVLALSSGNTGSSTCSTAGTSICSRNAEVHRDYNLESIAVAVASIQVLSWLFIATSIRSIIISSGKNKTPQASDVARVAKNPFLIW